MTSPETPDGKFVTVEGVRARYEGDLPNSRDTWLRWRIFDVENALMGLVPSLRRPLTDIEDDSTAAGDPCRVDRVRSLVVDKVLNLHRNPTGVYQVSQTVDDVTESRSYTRGSTATTIGFSEDELAQVRLRSRKRSKIGTLEIQPWRITC